MRFKDTLASCGAAAFLSLVGCAEAVPTELVDARAAYERAAQGPAQDLNPADLHVAKTSLEEAELAFKEEGASEITRDLAYIARRRAELAEANARAIAAAREVERLAEEVEGAAR